MARNLRFLIPRLYLQIMRHWEVYTLAILCVVIFVSHSLYVTKTHQYPEGGTDEHQYMEMATLYYDVFKELKVEKQLELLEVYKYRQPLYSFVLAIAFLFTGTLHAYKIALWINVLFYLITIVGVYFLGKEFLSKKAGLLASVIFAFYGFPLFYLHFTYTETAATAFVVMSLLFLAKSKSFMNTKYTILFSIFLFLGSLTRWVVPIFVVGPAILVALVGINAFIREPKKRKTLFFNTGIFFMFAILPSIVLYYLPNLLPFKAYITANTSNGASWVTEFLGMPELANVFSIRSVMFYLNVLSQQTIFFWLLFVAGFLICLIFIKRYAFFLLAFIVPYAFFTFGSVWKTDRLIVPIYPVMALISAVVIQHAGYKKLSILLSSAILILGSLNFIASSWGLGPMGKQGLKDIVLPSFIHHPRRIYLTPMVWPPRPEEGNVISIINAIKEDWKSSKPFIYTPAYEMPQISNGFHTILGYQERGIGVVAAIRGEKSYDTVFKKLQSADYVLVKNGIIDQYKEGEHDLYDSDMYLVRRFNDVLRLTHRSLPQAYVLVKKISIPFDKSTLFIYRKKRNMTRDEWINLAKLFVLVDPKNETDIQNALRKVTADRE